MLAGSTRCSLTLNSCWGGGAPDSLPCPCLSTVPAFAQGMCAACFRRAAVPAHRRAGLRQLSRPQAAASHVRRRRRPVGRRKGRRARLGLASAHSFLPVPCIGPLTALAAFRRWSRWLSSRSPLAGSGPGRHRAAEYRPEAPADTGASWSPRLGTTLCYFSLANGVPASASVPSSWCSGLITRGPIG